MSVSDIIRNALVIDYANYQRVKGLGGKSKVKEVIKTTADGKITKPKQKPRGKLTGNVINILQNYFGITLRSGAKTC